MIYYHMSQAEWFTTYLQYENLKDMLSVILYTSQSFMTITPLLYYITYQNKEILFIHTGIAGGIISHYHIIKEKPSKKFVELNKMTGNFNLVDNIGSNSQSGYVPIVRLIKSTLRFPIAERGWRLKPKYNKNSQYLFIYNFFYITYMLSRMIENRQLPRS